MREFFGEKKQEGDEEERVVSPSRESRSVFLFQVIRANLDKKFHDMYEESVSIANEHGEVLPTMPRSTQRQRANDPVESHLFCQE